MPEIRDLDGAFDALLTEVDAPSRAGGAAAAIQTSRRRRTTLAGAAAVALIAAGGIATAQVLDSGSGDIVTPAGTPSVPEPSPFDPDALNRAAPTWTEDAWVTPTQMDLAVVDTSDALWRCLDAHDGPAADSEPEPARSGRHLTITPEGEITTTTFGDFTGQAAPYATTLAGMDAMLSACAQGTVTTTEYADGAAMTTYVMGSAGGKVQSAWLGHVDERIALMIAVTDDAPTVEERSAVGDALLAGAQADATFQERGPEDDGEAQGSDAGTGEMALTRQQLQEALGDSFDLSTPAGDASDTLPCADTSVLSPDTASGASIGERAVQEVLSFSSNTDAMGSWGSLVDQLEACNSTRWEMTTHTATSLAWESPAGTLWMDVVGSELVVLTLTGAVDLPADVKLAVARLLA